MSRQPREDFETGMAKHDFEKAAGRASRMAMTYTVIGGRRRRGGGFCNTQRGSQEEECLMITTALIMISLLAVIIWNAIVN